MPLSQNAHIQDQYETGSHMSSRTTPSSEPDNRSANGSRKRVPVAVCLQALWKGAFLAFVLTTCSVRDVENARSSVVAMKETVRVVQTAKIPASGIPVAFFESAFSSFSKGKKCSHVPGVID